jgi:predicted DNA-binding protein (MmcQ/YjbR family)
MSIEDIQAICRTLKGVKEDIKWEDHLCFNVGGKMFLVTSPDNVPVSASFKVSDEDFDQVISKPGFSPQRHLGRYKWVSLDDINRLSATEWEGFILQSYGLIASKLSRKFKQEIGLL